MRFQGSKCNLICTLLHHFDSCTTWSCKKNGTQQNTSSMSYMLLASRTFSIIHFERLQWANYYNSWTWMSECFGILFWGGIPLQSPLFWGDQLAEVGPGKLQWPQAPCPTRPQCCPYHRLIQPKVQHWSPAKAWVGHESVLSSTSWGYDAQGSIWFMV